MAVVDQADWARPASSWRGWSERGRRGVRGRTNIPLLSLLGFGHFSPVGDYFWGSSRGTTAAPKRIWTPLPPSSCPFPSHHDPPFWPPRGRLGPRPHNIYLMPADGAGQSRVGLSRSSHQRSASSIQVLRLSQFPMTFERKRSTLAVWACWRR